MNKAMEIALWAVFFAVAAGLCAIFYLPGLLVVGILVTLFIGKAVFESQRSDRSSQDNQEILKPEWNNEQESQHSSQLGVSEIPENVFVNDNISTMSEITDEDGGLTSSHESPYHSNEETQLTVGSLEKHNKNQGGENIGGAPEKDDDISSITSSSSRRSTR